MMIMTVILRRRFLSVSFLVVVVAFLLPLLLLLVDGAFFISSPPPLSSSSCSRRSNGRGDCNGRNLLLAQRKSGSSSSSSRSSRSSSRSSSLLFEGTSTTTEYMVVMEPPPPSTTNIITTKSIQQRQQQLQEKEATLLSPPPPAPTKVKAKTSLPYKIKIQTDNNNNNNNNNTESCRRSPRHSHNHKIIKPFTNLMIRYLEDDDLPSVVRMYVKEFGPANQNHNIIIRLQDVVHKFKMTMSRRRHDNNSSNNNKSLGGGVTTTQTAAVEETNDAFVFVYNMYTYVHNFVLAFSIYLGLISRIRWKNYCSTKQQQHQPDYHILCLADNETNQIIGIAELSWQLPYQTSPPYILPLSIKRLLSKFVYRFNLPAASTTTKDNTSGGGGGGGGGDDGGIALKTSSSPANDDDSSDDDYENLIRLYVSNVIIHESYRGYNYGSVLMREVIRHAKEYFQPSNNQLTLHVDASSSSSAPISSNDDGDETANNNLVAQSLYLKMGFRPIQDERSGNTDMLLSLLDSSPFPTSNEKREKEGIFFCDGKPMMYMGKYLSD